MEHALNEDMLASETDQLFFPFLKMGFKKVELNDTLRLMFKVVSGDIDAGESFMDE